DFAEAAQAAAGIESKFALERLDRKVKKLAELPLEVVESREAVEVRRPEGVPFERERVRVAVRGHEPRDEASDRKSMAAPCTDQLTPFDLTRGHLCFAQYELPLALGTGHEL